MGQTQSAPIVKIAKTCKYNKKDFNELIEVIKDAHRVVQYYATVLLKEKMPIQVDVVNFGESAEDHFNSRRKEEIPEFMEINDKIKNYYDFYKALDNLPVEYSRNDITENERRNKITQVFNLCHVTLSLLIQELGVSCESQTLPPQK